MSTSTMNEIEAVPMQDEKISLICQQNSQRTKIRGLSVIKKMKHLPGLTFLNDFKQHFSGKLFDKLIQVSSWLSVSSSRTMTNY